MGIRYRGPIPVSSTHNDRDNAEPLAKAFSGADLIKDTSAGDGLTGYAFANTVKGRAGHNLILGNKGKDDDRRNGGNGREMFVLGEERWTRHHRGF